MIISKNAAPHAQGRKEKADCATSCPMHAPQAAMVKGVTSIALCTDVNLCNTDYTLFVQHRICHTRSQLFDELLDRPAI